MTPHSSSAAEREALLQRHHQYAKGQSQTGRYGTGKAAQTGVNKSSRNGARRATSRSSHLSTTQESTADEHDAYQYEENDDEEHDARSFAGSSDSAFSHMLLDTTPTYVRLICSHVMALLPCVALLLASVMLAWHAPCHIHQALPLDKQEEERRTCSRLLSDRVSLAAFGLGVVCWLAAFSVRPALWKVVEVCLRLAFLADLGSGKITSRAATLLFVVLKTTALEVLRLFSVLLVNALIFAGLLKVPHLGSDETLAHTLAMQRRWTLHWYDPRFTVAVWLAVGWAMTEFLVSSWQLFDRLSLYEVDFDEHIKQHHHSRYHTEDSMEPGAWSTNNAAAAGTAEQPYTNPSDFRQHQQHLSDSDPSGEQSDSTAATVRARSSIHIPGPPGPEASDGAISGQFVKNDNSDQERLHASATLSPSARLRDARRRVLAAAEESGISLPQSDVPDEEEEVDELGALRQTLDLEMDALVKARTRVELEASFGQPLTSVPIVLCTLWRIDGWLWNLGSTLLMSASVTWAQGPLTGQNFPPLFPPVHTNATTLLGLIVLHSVFTTMWTMSLPVLGFAFVTYASMLAGLAICIIASARWGLLV